jgi:heavy metal sensor kinase
MKLFKSIKWRLQVWHGLILVAVLVGFGLTAYQLERGRQFRRIDNELMRRVGTLANVLRPPPRVPRPDQPPFDGPSSDQPLDDGPPGRDSGGSTEFHLPPQAAALFDANDPHGFYFIINTRDGKELARSTNAPKVEMMWDNQPYAKSATLPLLRDDPLHATSVQMLGQFREVFHRLPPGETVRVGCLVAQELKEFRLAALKLAVIGGIILLFGLAGGWWIAGRAIRPIEDISATTVKISAGDMSQRINVTEAESELGRLASVLNSTFARLEAAFAQQQQFTSDAAHELRTPVSVMLTQTQTALNRERGAAEYRETIEACQRAAQRMRKLIESLLELARLDSGQEPIRHDACDLSKIAADGIELIRPLAAARGIRIHTDLPVASCHGDADRLVQVVTNLLTNAIDYNLDGGEIRVTTGRDNGIAMLAVINSGPGISAEDLPHIFERFHRADKARSGTAGHSGLGLAIAKAIVQAHGGSIAAQSKPGKETIFTVSLPL